MSLNGPNPWPDWVSPVTPLSLDQPDSWIHGPSETDPWSEWAWPVTPLSLTQPDSWIHNPSETDPWPEWVWPLTPLSVTHVMLSVKACHIECKSLHQAWNMHTSWHLTSLLQAWNKFVTASVKEAFHDTSVKIYQHYCLRLAIIKLTISNQLSTIKFKLELSLSKA